MDHLIDGAFRRRLRMWGAALGLLALAVAQASPAVTRALVSTPAMGFVTALAEADAAQPESARRSSVEYLLQVRKDMFGEIGPFSVDRMQVTHAFWTPNPIAREVRVRIESASLDEVSGTSVGLVLVLTPGGWRVSHYSTARPDPLPEQ